MNGVSFTCRLPHFPTQTIATIESLHITGNIPTNGPSQTAVLVTVLNPCANNPTSSYIVWKALLCACVVVLAYEVLVSTAGRTGGPPSSADWGDWHRGTIQEEADMNCDTCSYPHLLHSGVLRLFRDTDQCMVSLCLSSVMRYIACATYFTHYYETT